MNHKAIKNIQRMMIVLTIGFGSLSLCNKPALAQQLKIYQLNHTLAADMLNIVKPFLEQSDIITARNYQLIVQTSAKNHQKIFALLKELDKKRQSLLISFAQTPQDVIVQTVKPYNKAETGMVMNPSIQLNQRSYSTTALDNRSIHVLSGEKAYLDESTVQFLSSMSVLPLTPIKPTPMAIRSRYFVIATLLPKNRVTVTIESVQGGQNHSDNSQRRRVQLLTTITGAMDNWIPVVSHVSSTRPITTYSTHALKEGVLAVKVSLLH